MTCRSLTADPWQLHSQRVCPWRKPSLLVVVVVAAVAVERVVVVVAAESRVGARGVTPPCFGCGPLTRGYPLQPGTATPPA
jgi:hypothetical protein